MTFAQFLAMGSVWGVELKEAELTTVKNIVEREEGSGAQQAKTNDKIQEKSKVTTAAASMAELTFTDSSITRMGANTLFSFQSKERLIKLDQGTLLIHTPPGNGGATVDCGGVTAAVTGTTFMATRDNVGNSVFVLLEGSGGMKITVGGTTTTIRPGQAASVGADSIPDSGSKGGEKSGPGAMPEASGGGKEKEGGDAANGPSPKAGGENGGGGSPQGKGGGGGEAGGGAAAPAEAPRPVKMPEIKVFDVDVKKIVATTPLITEFKAPLPSMAKIEATVEVQQAKVADGKMEKMEVEVVAISKADGDLLVGAPTVAKEDMMIVNSKEPPPVEKVEAKVAENAPPPMSGPQGLDIETAAGPGAGAAAPPPPAVSTVAKVEPPAFAPPPPIAPVVQTIASQIVQNATQANTSVVKDPFSFIDTQFVGATGTSYSLPAVNVPPSSVSFSILETDGQAKLEGGSLSIGKILGANTFTVRASFPGSAKYEAGVIDLVGRIVEDTAAMESANPARYLPSARPSGDELKALDQFFYYTGKMAGTQGPASFYSTDYQNKLLNLALPSFDPVLLFAGQTSRFYFGSSVELNSAAVSLDLGSQDASFFGKRVAIGSGTFSPSQTLATIPGTMVGTIPDGNAAGLASTVSNIQQSDLPNAFLPYAVRLNLAIEPDKITGAFLGDYVAYLRHTSADNLDSRTVKLFEHIGATTENPFGSAGSQMSVLLSDWAAASIASQDPVELLTGTYRPEVVGQQLNLNDLGAFPSGGSWTLWLGDTSGGGVGQLKSWSIELEQLMQPTTEISLTQGAGKTVTMVAGNEGLAVNSTWIKANQANLEFLSTGSLEMRGSQISGSGTQFLAEAAGTVKMGAQSTEAVPSPSTDTADREQVRILADTVTDAGGVAVAAPGSMAVVRTGESLELRNVTIRNFAETKLEKVKNGVTTGRVLMSGSMVRDFKIKELVGAAVNADAKIQMMAIDGKGALAGEMTVEGSLPVATQVASALAAANEILPSERADTQVHAAEIQLSADRVNFLNANVAAMTSITARANTIVVQNSFMTVVRNSGMINMYVQSGMVNQTWGSEVAGRLNFAGGISNFRIGNVVNFSIANSSDIAKAMGAGQLQEVSIPQSGKVNVLKL
jgi:hypothetical protein